MEVGEEENERESGSDGDWGEDEEGRENRGEEGKGVVEGWGIWELSLSQDSSFFIISLQNYC